MYRGLSLAFALIVFLGLAAGANAQDGSQDGSQEDFSKRVAAWEETATRVEQALRDETISKATLDQLRADAVADREEAFEIIKDDSLEVRMLQAQLDALPDPPGENVEEPAAVTERRAELLQAIATANAPTLAAREAYNRADVLVSEIDRIIRSRFTTDLMERSPSPLIPTHWPAAIGELFGYVGAVSAQIGTDLEKPENRTRFLRGLPIAIGLIIIALVVLLILQPWVTKRLDALVLAADKPTKERLYWFATLMVRLILPTIAGAAFYYAFKALAISPFAARSVVAAIVSLPIFLVVGYWLGQLVFSPTVPAHRVLQMDDKRAGRAAHLCLALGGVLVAEALVEAAGRDYDFTPASDAILSAIVVVTGSYFVWRLARTLIAARQAPADAPGRPMPAETGPGVDFVTLLGRLMQLAAVAAVVFVVFGYVKFARQAMVPTILSLGAIGFALAIYLLLSGLSRGLLRGRPPEDVPIYSIVPIAIAFVVIAAALPIFALIWGARVADLLEIWILSVQGVEVGGTRISIGVIFILIAVFLVGMSITRWLQRVLDTSVLPKTRMDRGARKAVLTGLGYTGVTLSALVAISVAGIDLSNLAIVAGALSVGIGFGLQAIVSNFVSGIILLIERPVKEGDWIEVSGYSGIVRRIAVRSTRIETFDRHEVIVPNSELITGTVTNMTLSSKTGRLIVPVGVAYGADIEKTQEILLEAARDNEKIMPNPEPVVLFVGLGESSIDFELRCFLADVNTVVTVKSELLLEIYRNLGQAGIEIPFPQRDITVRNVDALAEAIASQFAARASASQIS